MTKTQMLINYAPGDDCRIAIVEDGKLEEYSSESPKAISRVGNIYHGVVKNVEASIQAAFIDFGLDDHGFLHVTDLHPSYFPGAAGDAGDAVGKKTPRRERPPMQECLKRGQKLMVQVLKEGVGTKGPTLTSYLSIPGRFLVMMPQMDKVGVSRKVEDDEQRRKMREILDQLDLPDGFGFILRTAGFERTKLELKRDLAYLQRLWKDMETRRRQGKAPRLLYSESDLLVRSLRDQLTSDITEIVIDDEGALERTARFLKILTPRSRPTLLRFTGPTPLFHAFGVEQQIVNIHSREVPLPSGGRLVIDETEALVAIDVNSGRSRRARDAETNAYQTNIEAVDEICRQLRLRDLGGLVINDLIDMRDRRRRREIEARFKERLRRDRAKSTILPISEFGILEMTRQRMRGSHESQHFIDCPMCHGRGLVQRPDSVAADALRSLAAIIGSERVARVEMVVSPRVAGSLLSARRTTLSRIERTTGRVVDVRVSETVPLDRIAFYAYDAAGADVELDSLAGGVAKPDVEEVSPGGEGDWAVDPTEEQRPLPEPEPQVEDDEQELHPIELAAAMMDEEDEEEGESSGGRKKRKRRRRRKRKSDGAEEAVAASEQSAAEARGDSVDEDGPAQQAAETDRGGEQDRESDRGGDREQDAGRSEEGDGATRKKRRRRRRRRKGAGAGTEGGEQGQQGGTQDGDGRAEAPAGGGGSAGARQDDGDGGERPSGDEQDDRSGDRVSDGPGDGSGDGEVRKKKRRRRRKSSAKSNGAVPAGAEGSGDATDNGAASPEPAAAAEPRDAVEKAPAPARKKRTRRSTAKASAESGETVGAETNSEPDAEAPAKGRSRSRAKPASKTEPKSGGRSPSRSGAGAKDASSAPSAGPGVTDGQPLAASAGGSSKSKKPAAPRLLYTARRKLSPSERARIAEEG